MKTGQLFNQKQLIDISGLSQGQIRQLHKYMLLDRPKNPVRFRLTEAIYCRLIYWLRQYYSFQQVKQFVYPCEKYFNDLILKKYGVIEFTNNIAIELDLTDNLENLIQKKLENTYIYREIRQIEDKYQGSIDINICFVNLEAIRNELINRAYDYNLDSIEQKFRLA
jgi:hypothetical protein